MPIRKRVIVSCLALAACGGGDGDPVPIAFTSFTDLPANGTVVINGATKSAAFVTYAGGWVDLGPVTDNANATATVTLSNDVLTKLALVNTGADITIDEGQGGAFADFGPIIAGTSASAEQVIILVDDEDAGFNYQTHGIWISGYGTGSGFAAAGTFGNATAQLPASGTASYSGLATGLLTNQSGAAVTVAGLTASTDFNTVNIQTTGTQLVDLDTGADLGLRPDLDFSGSGPISGTGFTATIMSAGLAGSGEADGQFYGPNAEEIGGTYEMDGFVDPYQTLGGSFGGN